MSSDYSELLGALGLGGMKPKEKPHESELKQLAQFFLTKAKELGELADRVAALGKAK